MAMQIDMTNIPESMDEDNYDFKTRQNQLLPILEERVPMKLMENLH
jgi:hypothetical protein